MFGRSTCGNVLEGKCFKTVEIADTENKEIINLKNCTNIDVVCVV